MGEPMRTRLAFALAALLMAGCGDRRAFTEADSWYSPPPSNEPNTLDALERDHFALVSEPLQPEAQALLADVPAKRLTAGEATRLVGKSLPKGEEYVLLRAVMLNDRESGLSVRTYGIRVLVSHGTLGRHPVPMKRKALVAVLPTFPETVYVSCWMAE